MRVYLMSSLSSPSVRIYVLLTDVCTGIWELDDVQVPTPL